MTLILDQRSHSLRWKISWTCQLSQKHPLGNLAEEEPRSPNVPSAKACPRPQFVMSVTICHNFDRSHSNLVVFSCQLNFTSVILAT